MIGIIFTLFFFILGTFEFFGHGAEQLALTLYLISAIFYVGYAIFFNGSVKSSSSKAWSDALLELSKTVKRHTDMKESETNN